jgi:hypothetical protein
MSSYSAKDRADALRRLEADYAADDITVEEYTREEARINAGSSRSAYLHQPGLIERASSGERGAQVRLALRVAAIAAVVLVLGVVALIGAAVLSPSPAPVQNNAPTQAQPDWNNYDEDDFEEDDD